MAGLLAAGTRWQLGMAGLLAAANAHAAKKLAQVPPRHRPRRGPLTRHRPRCGKLTRHCLRRGRLPRHLGAVSSRQKPTSSIQEGAKSICAGAATIALAGAAVGIENVKQSFDYAILGFTLTKAIASFVPPNNYKCWRDALKRI